MNKFYFITAAFACMLLLTSCSAPDDTVEISTDSILVESPDTVSQCTPADTAEKFISEPGLIKMIRENYLTVMKGDHSFLIIPAVTGIKCGLISFEKVDSSLTVFRSGIHAPGYWLLKGENETYSSKIAKHYPDDIEIAPPKRPFAEYGLFQSSTLVFELRNNSEIVRWISISR